MNYEFCYSVSISTVMGNVGVMWQYHNRTPMVLRIFLPFGKGPHPLDYGAEFPRVEEKTCSAINDLSRDIRKFMEGNEVEFNLDMLDWGRCTEFQRDVLVAEHSIPYGWVSTYGRLAVEVGSPGGARAVGGALARNPFPIVIPCHRTVRSGGDLGGFGGGRELKRALLELEGVKFDRSGRVIMERVYY